MKLLMRGRAAVPGLLEVLEAGPDDTRFIVAQLLGKIGDERATEPLIAVLRDEQNGYIRKEAAEALGKLGDSRAAAPLLAALHDDPVPAVRVEAARGLVNLRHPAADSALVAALADWHPDVRKAAVLGLARLGYDGLGRLLPELTRDSDPTVRYVTVQLMGRSEAGVAEHVEVAARLIEALADESGPVREEAARALGRLRVEDAVEPLVEMLATDAGGLEAAAAAGALREITGVEYEVVE